jgi:hypothetical protein
VAWSLNFAWAAGVNLPKWVPVLLALGTWAVYVGDRLLDARAAFRSGNLALCANGIFSIGAIVSCSLHWPVAPLLSQLASSSP